MQINSLFKKIWCSRLISILGTGLTEFGISVWVYYSTGKVTPMMITMLCTIVPSILISPISGLICDKYNRKRIIFWADSLAAVMSLFILFYINLFEFNFGLICVFVFISSLANTFDTNAYQASITTLVKKEELKTANGLNQIIDSINTIFSPILAGILYSVIGLEGIIIIDLVSYLISMMIFLPVNKKNFSAMTIQASKEKELLKGFRFIWAQKSLLLLLIYFSLLNFLFNISTALIEPFGLSVGNTIELGIIKSCGGIGILCGGFFVSFYQFKHSPSKTISIGIILEGIALFLMGSTDAILFISLGRLLFSVMVPITNTIAGTLWMKKTPQELQGRVYASRAMVAKSLIPISYLLTGPLVDIYIPRWINSKNGFFLGEFLGREAIEYRSVFLTISIIVIIFTLGIYRCKTFKKLDNEI